jgi:hypothetical protein
MASFDRITGDYLLNTVGGVAGNGDIYFTANAGVGTIYINGNLLVTGQQSIVQSINTIVADNFITLGNGVVGHDSGVIINRGTSPNVSLRWNEAVDRWQITNDGLSYANIAAGGLLNSVFDDKFPQLGGNLNTNNFSLTSIYPTNVIITAGVDGTETRGALQITHAPPNTVVPSVTNASLLYAKAVGGGNTGLFVTDSKNRSEELITKRRALLFSLVL